MELGEWLGLRELLWGGVIFGVISFWRDLPDVIQFIWSKSRKLRSKGSGNVPGVRLDNFVISGSIFKENQITKHVLFTTKSATSAQEE